MQLKVGRTLQDALAIWWHHWSHFALAALLLWGVALIPWANFPLTALLTGSLLMHMTISLLYKLNHIQMPPFTFIKLWRLILFQLLIAFPVLVVSGVVALMTRGEEQLLVGCYLATLVLLDVFKAFPLSGAIGLYLGVASEAHSAYAHAYAGAMILSLFMSGIWWAVPYLILLEDLTLKEALHLGWDLTRRYFSSFSWAYTVWQLLYTFLFMLFLLGLLIGSSKDHRSAARGRKSNYVWWILVLFVIVFIFALSPTSVLFWTLAYFTLTGAYQGDEDSY